MALINCPECKKEMSDTLDKCPHCGFKVKNDNVKAKEVFDKFKDNKKLVVSFIIILALVLVLVIIIGLVLWFIFTTDQRSANKLVKHLEEIGYSCSYEKSDEQTICRRNEDGKTETMIVSDYFSSVYKIERKNEYTMEVKSDYYHKNENRGDNAIIRVEDLYHNMSCDYIPLGFSNSSISDSEIYWVVGDTPVKQTSCSYGGVSATNYEEVVDAMLREFESYYDSIGKTLK